MTQPIVADPKNSPKMSSATITARQPTSDDDLLAKMKSLSVGHSTRSGETKTNSPADFLALQSMRSSALAHKSSTGTKFGGSKNTADLMFTLLNQKATKKPVVDSAVEQPKSAERNSSSDRDSGTYVEEDSSSGGESKEGDLIERGPMRTVGRVHPGVNGNLTKPYDHPLQHQPLQQPSPVYQQYDVAPQAYHNSCQYSTPSSCVYSNQQGRGSVEWSPHTNSPSHSSSSGYNYNDSPDDSLHQLDCIQPLQLFDPTSKLQQQPQQSQQQTPDRQGQVVPFADAALSSDELARLLHVPSELPDALSDFILKFSRRYSAKDVVRKQSDGSSASGSDTPFSQASGQDSPRSELSFSARHNASPARPLTTANELTAVTPPAVARRQFKPTAMMKSMTSGRDRIRACVPEKERDEAWLWMCTCTRQCPGAIYYTDPDGDSLLHIVIWHGDLAKMYALVEQMLKNDMDVQGRKPFDLPNKSHETPLYLAVQRRLPDAVWYLLDVGADPNAQNRRGERDAALHYAASRGLVEIVDALTSHTATNVDFVNGSGLTPLLSAVKNHGAFDEELGDNIDNSATIGSLLKCGANASAVDRTNGKSVLHYAVDRVDPSIVDVIAEPMTPTALTTLAVQTNYDGDTPLMQLQRAIVSRGVDNDTAVDAAHKEMFVKLVSIGGAGPQT